MESRLERRLRYFLTTRRCGREDVRQALKELRRHGRLVLIGGMLRDLALFGNAGFRSDVDSVIVPDNLAAFDRYMKSINATVNKYGGYALPFTRWQIDVWPLERTWAHVEGYVEVKKPRDLLKATFFNSDAIIYDINHRRIMAEAEYFRDLDQRVLEINLLPNPNLQGNAVRAFRYALDKGFRWGPDLSEFLYEMIASDKWGALLEAKRRSPSRLYLDEINIDDLRRELRWHVSQGCKSPFNPLVFRIGGQPRLPLLDKQATETL